MTVAEQCRYTRLNPPENGFGAAILFFNGNKVPQEIGRWLVDAVAQNGSKWQLAIARRDVGNDVTIGTGGKPVMNVWNTAMGGGACPTDEAERLYSKSSTTSFRGNDYGGKLQQGYGVALLRGGVQHPMQKVCRAVAHGWPETEVDWRPNQNIRRIEVDQEFFDLSPDVLEGVPYFDPEDVTEWVSTGVYYQAGTGTVYASTRVVFGGDVSYYPVDASFSLTVPEYSIDSGLGVRINTATAEVVGADTVFLVYWDHVDQVLNQSALNNIGIKAMGSPAGKDDCVYGITRAEAVIDEEFLVLAGAGFVGWRWDSSGGAGFFLMEFDGSGDVVGLSYREEADDDEQEISVSPVDYVFPFHVRVEKTSGGRFRIYTKQSAGDSWVTLGEHTFAAWGDAMGLLAVGSVGFASWSRTEDVAVDKMDLSRDGMILGGLRSTESPLIGTYAIDDPYPGESPTSVVNLATGEEMVLSTEARRDTYHFVGDQYIFFCEGNTDGVRMIYPNAAKGAKPGRPPRLHNQLNGATAGNSSSDPRGIISTVIPGENVLNARDLVEVFWEIDLEPLPGDEIVGYAYIAFDPEAEFSFEINEGGTGGLEVVSPTNYRAFKAAGYVLLDEVYRAGLAEVVNWRAVGEMPWLLQTPGSDLYKQFKGGLNCLSSEAMEIAKSGGSSHSYQGAAVQRLDYNNNFCSPIGPKVGEYHWGFGALNYEAPYWYHNHNVAGLGYVGSVTGYNKATYSPEVFECNDETHYFWEHQGGNAFYVDYPFGANITPPAGNSPNIWFGNEIVTKSIGQGIVLDLDEGTYKFTGTPIGGGGLMHLPDGAIIEKAEIDVFCTGVFTIKKNFLHETSNDMCELYEAYQEGQLIQRYTKAGGWENYPVPADVSGATITFNLIGVEESSREIVDYAGNHFAGNADIFHSLGAGISTDIPDGVWSKVDVTRPIQRILQTRDAKYRTYELVPTTGISEYGEEGGHGLTLLGQGSASFTRTGSGALQYDTSAAINSVITYMHSMSLGALHVWWRMPGGIVTKKVLPFSQPPFGVSP